MSTTGTEGVTPTEGLYPSEGVTPTEGLYPSDGVGFNDCVWPIDHGCYDETEFTAEQLERGKILATSALRSLTAYRVGGCPTLVRPCARPCLPLNPHGATFVPTLYAGEWLNNGCRCSSTCGCSALSEVVLPAPVGIIYGVKVDGVLLEPSQYTLDGNRLLRLDGESWPTCQNMALEDDQPGTFSVSYLNGYPVDALGALAAGVLTAEFAKACGGKKCRLPSGVTQVTRQGIAMEVGADAFPNRRTGIREVDIFLERWNPYSLTAPPRVLSPDLRRGGRR